MKPRKPPGVKGFVAPESEIVKANKYNFIVY